MRCWDVMEKINLQAALSFKYPVTSKETDVYHHLKLC